MHAVSLGYRSSSLVVFIRTSIKLDGRNHLLRNVCTWQSVMGCVARQQESMQMHHSRHAQGKKSLVAQASTPDEGCDELMSAVRTAASFSQLHDLLQQHGDAIDRDILLCFFVRVCKLARQPQSRIPGDSTSDGFAMSTLADKLLLLAQRLFVDIDEYEAAHMVLALALTGQHVHGRVLGHLCAACEGQLISYSPDCMSKLLWGLAVLGYTPSDAWLQQAAHGCLLQATMLSHRQVVRVVEAFARLKFHPPAAMLLDLTVWTQSRLEWLTPSQLSSLIISLAALGFMPPSTWMRQFMMNSRTKLPGMTAGDCAALLSALAQFRYTPPPWWLKVFFTVSQRRVLFVPARSTPETVPAAISMLYTVARLNWQAPPSWLHDVMMHIRGRGRQSQGYVSTHPSAPSLLQLSQSRVPSSSGGGGSTSSRGSSTSRSSGSHQDSSSSRPADATVYSNMQLHASTAHAAGTWAKASTTMTSVTPSHNRELSARNAVKALYAVAKLRDNPCMVRHVQWAKKLLPRLCQDKEVMSSLGAQELVDLLYVVAELDYKPKPGLGPLLTCLQVHIPMFSTNNCATAIVCLAVKKELPGDVWCAAFYARMADLLKQFRAQELANILTATAYLNLELASELLASVLQQVKSYDLVELAMFVRKLDQSKVAGPPWLLALKKATKQYFSTKA